MKKTLLRILLCIMAVCMAIGIAGCNEGKWQGTEMKKWGDVESSNGGFMVETENYFYYINGYTSYGDENTFGKPIKGALMAVEKSSIASGEFKTQVVVPKLFAASDYNAGVFIYGDYVYYGSPSTDKNNAGEIAVSEMTFARTKLDGTDTTTYFTVGSLSTEYRFIEVDGKVHLVYHDSENKALKVYNTSTKTSETIAKTSSTTKDKYESLGAINFVEGEGVNGVSVFYTVTVYAENYYEEAAKKDDYARTEETYNKVYSYKIGDKVQDGNEFKGTCVLDGKTDENLYEVTLVKDNYIFYTQTDLDGKEEHFVVDFSSANGFANPIPVTNPECVNEYTFIVSLDEVYALHDSDKKDETSATIKHVVKTTLIGDTTLNFERVALVGAANDIVEIREDNGVKYVYYIDTTNALARTELATDASDDFNREERVSEGAIVYSWYAPEIFQIGNDSYAFYSDNTVKGGSYIKAVKISQPATEEDTDEDGENDSFYLEGAKLLGKVIDADYAAFAIIDLSNIGAPIEYEKDEDGNAVLGENGKVICEKVDTARASYNALSKEAKEIYGEANLEKLEKAELAVKAINALVKLEDLENYYYYDEATQAQYKADYDVAKAVMAKIEDDDYVMGMIENNLKAYVYNVGAYFFENK